MKFLWTKVTPWGFMKAWEVSDLKGLFEFIRKETSGRVILYTNGEMSNYPHDRVAHPEIENWDDLEFELQDYNGYLE